MQAFHSFDYGGAMQVGHAVRILCVCGESGTELAARFAALGGLVEIESELYTALSTVIEDPAGYDLLVLDCDSLGGSDAALTAERTLRAVASRLPLLLISGDYATHSFPESRDESIRLKAPVSNLSLRIGYEHALRDLNRWLAATQTAA